MEDIRTALFRQIVGDFVSGLTLAEISDECGVEVEDLEDVLRIELERRAAARELAAGDVDRALGRVGRAGE